LLAYPGISIARLSGIWPKLKEIAPDVARQLEHQGRYRPYLLRQEADVRAFHRDAQDVLPADFDAGRVAGLSTEVRQKLQESRPANLAAAGRIAGVTPAALTAILVHLRKQRRTAGS
jgi:tRNA uridine 5-carboxymethylaminomethyl modification enzyme